MELGHLLTRYGLTYPEVSSKVCHVSFCQLGNSVSLPWVIYYGAFYLHVVSSFSCIPVICLKLVLFLTPLQFVHSLCNQSKYILLFFSCISSPLLLFFWHLLLWNCIGIVNSTTWLHLLGSFYEIDTSTLSGNISVLQDHQQGIYTSTVFPR